MAWPVSLVPWLHINHEWSPETTWIDIGNAANTVTFDSHQALDANVRFTPSLMLYSLQPRIHPLILLGIQVSGHSRVKTRPLALETRPFASGYKYLATPGSTTMLRHTSSEKVCVPLATLDLCAACSSRAYF